MVYAIMKLNILIINEILFPHICETSVFLSKWLIERGQANSSDKIILSITYTKPLKCFDFY